MLYQYHPYIWPLLISAMTTLSLGVYTLLKKRDNKGTWYFVASMFAVTLWSVGNALEIASLDFSTKLFWANIQYFAYCYSPVTLLALCMDFSGYDQWIKDKKVLWFALLPTIIILLVWTDPWHGLIRYDMTLDCSGAFPVISKQYGSLFYVHAAYSHSLNLFAWVLLIRATFLRKTVYRKQAAALLMGLSLIIIPNLLYISGLSPIKRFDLTPLFFAPAGLIMAWAIFRYKMLDVIPVAWATVLEAADTGIMVLDLGNRVLDVNPAFARKIGTEAPAVAQEVAVVCGSIPELLDLCIKQTAIQVEFSRCINGQIKVFEARRSPLTDEKGGLIGHLVLIYDITEKKLAQKEYLRKQREIVSIEERERLARDLHDNLAQVLGFINFQTAGIRQELLNADITMVEPELNKLVAVTQKTHEEIREYIRQTRNSVKMDKDFLTELSCEITAFEEQSGLQVDLDISCELAEETFKYPVCMHILQIIKEALNNIRKHAVAKKAKISLVIQQEQLRVTIEDDGKGFDCVDCEQIAQGNSTGFGLNIIRERAEAIGAQLRITSVLGKGTRVVLIMPTAEGGINHDVESDAG